MVNPCLLDPQITLTAQTNSRVVEGKMTRKLKCLRLPVKYLLFHQRNDQRISIECRKSFRVCYPHVIVYNLAMTFYHCSRLRRVKNVPHQCVSPTLCQKYLTECRLFCLVQVSTKVLLTNHAKQSSILRLRVLFMLNILID